LGQLSLGEEVPIFTSYSSKNSGVLNYNQVSLQLHGNSGSGFQLVNTSFTGAAYSYFQSLSYSYQALGLTLQNAHTSVNVNFQNPNPTIVYFFAYKWVPGLYRFSQPFTIVSSAPGGNNRANASQLVVLTHFSGVLRFEAGFSSLFWDMTIKTPGSGANLVFTFAVPAHYHWGTAYNGWNKCYEIGAVLQGRHMANLVWLPGPCDHSVYTLPDCFTNPDYGYDNQVHYAYRYWQTGAPCPETQCCCTSGLPQGASHSGWGDCAATNFWPSYGGGQSCAQYYSDTYYTQPCST